MKMINSRKVIPIMAPLVTVYLVNHNYGRFLERSIQSVLDQEFQDYELIIVDDGSTDHSHAILDKYELMKNINVVRQQNKGLTVTNNIALKMSSGKYIMRLDADDYLHPKALGTLAGRLEEDPALALVFPDYYEVDEYGKILHHVKRHNFDDEVTLFDLPAHGACTMFRREVLRQVGGYDERFTRQDGYDIWLNIIDRFKVSNINEPLFYYRQHRNSLTRDERALLETRAQIIRKHVKNRKKPQLNVISIIPVRGSSIDSRSDPLRIMGGKPLVNWTVSESIKSREVKNTLLSTPDEDVIRHVNNEYGNLVRIHKRDAQLARINVSLAETIDQVLESIQPEEYPDAFFLLNMESPFRTHLYIDKAIHVMQLYDVDVVIGVRMDDDMFYTHDGTGLKPRRGEGILRLERDDLFRKVGGMTLVKTSFWRKEKRLIGGKIGHVILDQKAALTIKSETDWDIAEVMHSISKS